MVKIDMKEMLEKYDIPRPHYVLGTGSYEDKGKGLFLIHTKINFRSKGNPAISDRVAGKYVRIPHVNFTECLHAFYNALHIESHLKGYGARILRRTVIEPYGIILPDRVLDLEIEMLRNKELERIMNLGKGKEKLQGIAGRISGTIFDKGRKLIKIKSNYWVEKPKK